MDRAKLKALPLPDSLEGEQAERLRELGYGEAYAELQLQQEGLEALDDAELPPKLPSARLVSALAQESDDSRVEGHLDRVESALDARRDGDLESVALAMHALRSSSEMIGATELGRAAAALEDTVRQGAQPEAEAWERLEVAWDRARSFLQESR